MAYCLLQLFRQGCALHGLYCERLLPELCAFHGKFPQHHFRVGGKVAVYRISLRRSVKAYPFWLFQGRPVPSLEKQDIRHHFRPRIF